MNQLVKHYVVVFVLGFSQVVVALPFHTMESQYYFEKSSFLYKDKINLGQGHVGEVNGEMWDVVIPTNRKTWAIAVAHGHQLMRNILRTEAYPINIFLATALKESSLGCDHSVVNDPTLTNPMRPIWDCTDGFYQIEGWESSAYGEMMKLYPKRFKTGGHALLMGGDHFETATISKVYYDLMVLHYWKYIDGYQPMKLFELSKDQLGLVKMLSASFYMGHQIEGTFYKHIFVDSRAEALETNDYMSFFSQSPYDSDGFIQMAKDHAKLVSQMVGVLGDNASLVGNPPKNDFHNFYDETISSDDLGDYLEKIKPMYPEVDFSQLKIAILEKFNSINSGADLSFRNEFAPVIDEIILRLPVENIVPGFEAYYVQKWDESMEYVTELGSGIASVELTIQGVLVKIVRKENYLQFILPESSNALKIQVYDIEGRLIEEPLLADQDLDISSIARGKYFVKGVLGDTHFTLSFIK